jgi:hypothetical protein
MSVTHDTALDAASDAAPDASSSPSWVYRDTWKVEYRQVMDDWLVPDPMGVRPTPSPEDVRTLCHQLYLDELVAVFGAESVVDDVLDRGYHLVLALLATYAPFEADVAPWLLSQWGEDRFVWACALLGPWLFSFTHPIIGRLRQPGPAPCSETWPEWNEWVAEIRAARWTGEGGDGFFG